MRVRPLPQQGLDHALGLAVRAWCVGPSAPMPDPVPIEQGAAVARAKAFAIVRHHPLDPDATSSKPRARAGEKSRGPIARLVRFGTHLAVGQPGGVINRHVERLPADPTDTPRAIAMDPMPYAADSPQALRIHMDQLTGPLALVAHDRGRWREPRQAG